MEEMEYMEEWLERTLCDSMDGMAACSGCCRLRCDVWNGGRCKMCFCCVYVDRCGDWNGGGYDASSVGDCATIGRDARCWLIFCSMGLCWEVLLGVGLRGCWWLGYW